MTKIGSICLILLGSNFLPGKNKVVLDSVLVSASRFETTLQSINRNVVVLNRKDIEQIPVNSISELLDLVVGIDARQRGIFGGQTDLSIRGTSFEQVLVLLNGLGRRLVKAVFQHLREKVFLMSTWNALLPVL